MPVFWSTFAGLGPQNGAANRAVYQFVNGGAVTGAFSTITLPAGLTSQFVVN
jgi:hypothetical protein